MKKLLVLLISLLLLVGCSSGTNSSDNENKLVISATAEPHATILEFAKPLLEELGYEVEIEILDNYYIFNEALNGKEVDANYFQHIPFFNGEVSEKGYSIANAGGVHIEPFGFYSKRYTNVDDIPKGALVVISNSVADHGRILAILDNAGVITLKEGVDSLNATLEDVVENPKNLKFEEVNPEFLTSVYNEDSADLVAINGNYAIGAGLNPVKDAVILESADETNPYVNIVACHVDDLDSQKIKDLVAVLQGDEVKAFISEHYADGSVIPVE